MCYCMQAYFVLKHNNLNVPNTLICGILAARRPSVSRNNAEVNSKRKKQMLQSLSLEYVSNKVRYIYLKHANPY